MSKHFEERYYSREEQNPGNYEEHRRSHSRKRSQSRSRHRSQQQQHDDQYYRHNRVERSGSGSSISSISDYEKTERPLVRCPRDVIRAPTPPPVIQRVVERAPTPEPDVVERVIVRPQPQQLIERIIERPKTPPPRIINKEICEPAPPPIVRTRIVKVDHSPKHYVNASTRYVQSPRAGLSDYGAYNDYEYYGYDNSYSTSYSTSEMYPTQGYSSGYMTNNYMPQQTQQMNVGMGAQQYASASPYGYTYGYRPANSGMYNSNPAPQFSQTNLYPRQY